MKPKISVVMAVYNGSRYIDKQLESILVQSCPVDEIVIVDDDSPEKCLDEIRRVTERVIPAETSESGRQGQSGQMNSAMQNQSGQENSNPLDPTAPTNTDPQDQSDGCELAWTAGNGITRIRYMEHENNMGYAQTFFHALERANGEVIFFADQDDIWEKTKVEICVRFLKKHPDISCLSSSNRLIDGGGRFIRSEKKPRKQLTKVDAGRLIFQKKFTLQPGMTLAIRKRLKEQISWIDTSVFEMHDRLVEYVSAIEGGYFILSAYLNRYRIHDTNTSGKNLTHTKLRTGLEGRVDQIEKEVRYLRQIRGVSKHYEKKVNRCIMYYQQRKRLLQSRNLFKYLVGSFRCIGRYSSIRVWLGDLAAIAGKGS